jgi:hypothetical protein
MKKKYDEEVVTNRYCRECGRDYVRELFQFLDLCHKCYDKLFPLKGLNMYANGGKKKSSPNTQDSMENQTLIGSKGLTKNSKKTLSKEEREERNEKAKLARILEKAKRARKARQQTANFYKRKAVQIRQAEEAYLPTPNQDYTYQFFCGAPKRIRKNERTRARSSGGKNMRVFWQSKWQGNSSDFN